jgi:hypothetical protein
MSANHLHPRSTRAHVFDVTPARATHVSDSALIAANPPTLRYTLAGFPPGNLRAGRSARCG